ncbi:MAG: efflux RND transporter permease subunit [Bacteroidales bacterium]|nr:efflux RND transporter permease subunit [Bacteroidales bacterium]
MKHTFSILLTLCILLLVGAALVPGLDIADKPRPRQGSTLTISYQWRGASAKVVEQNVTSRIEGLVSSVGGVESVSSVSNFGSGRVTVQLKEGASVAGAKFEIASLLRQMRDKFPEGVSWPTLSGGEVVTSSNAPEKNRPLLTWHVNANVPDREIGQRLNEELKPQLERIEGVRAVNVSGGTEKYMEITYDAVQLSYYRLTANDVEEAIRNYMGRENIVGDVLRTDDDGALSRVSMLLTIDTDRIPLESLPVKVIDGKIVYLNNLATCRWREREPDSYYRVNGMNTVYLSIFADEEANISRVADDVSRHVARWEQESASDTNRPSLHFTLSYNRADEQFEAFRTTISRSGLSLLILLIFVWLSRRNVRYLAIITIALLANLLTSVIAFRLFDLRLHPVSMAGLTVSLGLIIDSTIVMVDHYSYHRDRGAFAGIVGAMLTTIGALAIIFWLPEKLQAELFDFSWIVIINLAVAVVVSFLFVPALTDAMHYASRQQGRPRHLPLLLWWNRIYRGYTRVATHRVWRWPMLLLCMGGFAWSLMLFVDSLDSNVYRPEQEEMQLHIRGQMPLGGTAKQLNEKVLEVEAFLSQYPEIRRFETSINRRGAYINVSFKPEELETGFPYFLENQVIGKLITIGGADWSTYGVNPRGFSNSLNLQHRSERIDIVGYDYDRLYRYAEEMVRHLQGNGRVVDLAIQIPNRENQEDEFFMEYDHEKLTMDSVTVQDIYRTMSTLLYTKEMGRRRFSGQRADIVLTPLQRDSLDMWQLRNSFVRSGGRDVRLSDFMNIQQRQAKNTIPRQNQEYVLRVAFNVLGSWNYVRRVVEQTTDKFNASFPVGFRCISPQWMSRAEEQTQYWLIGLVVVIIYFIAAIMFESLYQALVIIMLIPFSLMGMFLTFHFSEVEFGAGGFAAMVLLCGLTVNAGIYLLNEYNQNGRNYLRAYNHKIIPILLTVLSTICGLLPFLADGPAERFWFPFAVGSIGGLLFSLVVVVFVLPMLLRRKKTRPRQVP